MDPETIFRNEIDLFLSQYDLEIHQLRRSGNFEDLKDMDIIGFYQEVASMGDEDTIHQWYRCIIKYPNFNGIYISYWINMIYDSESTYIQYINILINENIKCVNVLETKNIDDPNEKISYSMLMKKIWCDYDKTMINRPIR